MLDNTRRGFLEELLGVSGITCFLVGIGTWYNSVLHNYHPLLESIVVGFFPIFFLSFFIVRIIRMSMIYRNYKVLYVIVNFLAILSFGSLAVVYKEKSLTSFAFSVGSFTVLVIMILLIKRARKTGRFKVDIPPERYLSLRSVMTFKQRLTLVFPDRYIKYLETGDKRYLRGE